MQPDHILVARIIKPTQRQHNCNSYWLTSAVFCLKTASYINLNSACFHFKITSERLTPDRFEPMVKFALSYQIENCHLFEGFKQWRILTFEGITKKA